MSRIAFTHLIGLSLLFLSHLGFCQKNVILSGKVLDLETGKPLAFSTISILGTSKGAISNFLGEFELEIPAQHSKDSLLVSILGYYPQQVAICDVVDLKKIAFKLSEQVIVLSEVEVSAKYYTARQIVEKVIEHIPVNYPTQPYLLEGFTRSHKRECGKYVALYEAVFELYGQGYHKKNPERIYIKESRQSAPVDYYKSQVLRKNRNLFISMAHINDVLFRTYSLHLASNEYEIENYTMMDDRLVCIIKTTHSPDIQQRMFIDADRFALLKAEMEMKTLPGEEWNPLLNKGTSSDSTTFQVTSLSKTIQFEDQNGLYYPKYMDWLVEGNLYIKEEKKPFCDWGFRFETMFDKVADGAVSKPSNERLMRPKQGKDPDPTPYNPDFWRDYKILEEFPITQQIVLDLENNTDLETQFKQSSKKND